jgi:hypothetical protein
MKYLRWKIRVDKRLSTTYRRVALQQGWEFADFIRALITLAATIKWHGLPGDEIFKRRAMLGAFLGTRRTLPQPGSVTGLINVHLPQRLAESLTIYAAAVGSSRNEVVNMLLKAGLIVYLKAENAMIKAITETRSKPRSDFISPPLGTADSAESVMSRTAISAIDLIGSSNRTHEEMKHRLDKIRQEDT